MIGDDSIGNHSQTTFQKWTQELLKQIVKFDEAVEAGVRINIDNISVLEQFGLKYGNKVPVCIRINPHILGGGHQKISTGHIDSKFGISIYQMAHVHRIVETNEMKIEGILIIHLIN